MAKGEKRLSIISSVLGGLVLIACCYALSAYWWSTSRPAKASLWRCKVALGDSSANKDDATLWDAAQDVFSETEYEVTWDELCANHDDWKKATGLTFGNVDEFCRVLPPLRSMVMLTLICALLSLLLIAFSWLGLVTEAKKKERNKRYCYIVRFVSDTLAVIFSSLSITMGLVILSKIPDSLGSASPESGIFAMCGVAAFTFLISLFDCTHTAMDSLVEGREDSSSGPTINQWKPDQHVAKPEQQGGYTNAQYANPYGGSANPPYSNPPASGNPFVSVTSQQVETTAYQTQNFSQHPPQSSPGLLNPQSAPGCQRMNAGPEQIPPTSVGYSQQFSSQQSSSPPLGMQVTQVQSSTMITGGAAPAQSDFGLGAQQMQGQSHFGLGAMAVPQNGHATTFSSSHVSSPQINMQAPTSQQRKPTLTAPLPRPVSAPVQPDFGLGASAGSPPAHASITQVEVTIVEQGGYTQNHGLQPAW